MTEIKSAIEYLEDVIGIVHRNKPDGKFSEVKLAIRSLQAWEEVLQELEEALEENKIFQTYYNDGEHDGIELAIDIIKQKLSDVPDNNVGEIEERKVKYDII